MINLKVCNFLQVDASLMVTLDQCKVASLSESMQVIKSKAIQTSQFHTQFRNLSCVFCRDHVLQNARHGILGKERVHPVFYHSTSLQCERNRDINKTLSEKSDVLNELGNFFVSIVGRTGKIKSGAAIVIIVLTTCEVSVEAKSQEKSPKSTDLNKRMKTLGHICNIHGLHQILTAVDEGEKWESFRSFGNQIQKSVLGAENSVQADDNSVINDFSDSSFSFCLASGPAR